MKEKTSNFSVDTDVNSIECDLYCAHLILAPAGGEKLTVEYPDCKNVNAGCGDGTLIVNQQRRKLFAHKKQAIKIYVPEHTVPALKITGKHLAVEITDGIYGELAVTADDGAVSLSGGSFGEAEITGGDVSVYLNGVTVKGGLIIKLDRGNVLSENTFATRCECRAVRGNIGHVKFNCKDGSFDTQKGNITASLSGSASDFNTDLFTKEGTVNGESQKPDGAEGNFHAYTKKGNIVLDFEKDGQKENA